MKHLLVLFIVFTVTLQCAAQSGAKKDVEEKDRRDECVVYFFEDAKILDELEEDEDDEVENRGSFEIGRFFGTGREGNNVVKKFPRTKSKLYVVASVHYDDDLFYGEYLRDAMTLNLSAALTGNVKGPFLAFSSAQVEHNNYFGAANTSLLFSYKGKQKIVHMECKNLNPVSMEVDDGS